MNNNTKIRLRLSKNLFESLTKEILAEAKVNDGYSVAVKQPKMPKQSKSQATSPEVQKTDSEKTMEEGPKEKRGHDAESLKKAKAAIEKRLAEMETNVAEDKIED